MYECQPSGMLKHMLNAVNKRLPNVNSIESFSIAIDATKVPQLLEISTAFKAIMGAAHPHHLISTIDLDSTTIKHILDCETIFNQADESTIKIDKASEVKLHLWSFRSPYQVYLPLSLFLHGHNRTMNVLALLQTS